MSADRDPGTPRARLLPLGDSAWTVEFGSTIAPALNARVMALAARLRSGLVAGEPALAGVQDVVPSFRSLTVQADPWQADLAALGAHLQALADDVNRQAATTGLADEPAGARHWCLPACFDADLAPDLAPLAVAKGLTPAQLVERLLGLRLRVDVIGFMPGFPYMSGWPEDLALPRLAVPRARVPARSLAVAGTMACVYPWESPGGWHLLGRTPLPLFDLREAGQPAWLAAGDRVRWQAVDRTHYEQLAQDFEAGRGRRSDFIDTGADA